MEEQDKELVIKAKDGDLDSFTELINKYKEKLYFLARNSVGNSQDAEDLSQMAFVRAWRNIGKFRHEASFQTWLIKILLNLCRSHLRNRYLVKIFSLLPDTVVPDKSIESDPVKGLQQKNMRSVLDKAILKLPTKQREVFVMKHLQGMKISEIAELLDISEGGVKSHLFKGVGNLQKHLKGLT